MSVKAKMKRAKKINPRKRRINSAASDRTNLESLINLSLSRKEFDNACMLIDRYISQHEQELTYHQLCVIANTLVLNDRLKEAFDVVMRALKMDANRPEAPEVLFWVYQNRNDRQAIKVIDRLIESGPPEKRSTYLYWKALYGNNNSLPELVIECVEAAGGPPEQSFEKYHEVTYSLILALCTLGMVDKAEAVIADIPSEIINETRYLPMALAQVSQARGENEEVVKIYDVFLEKHPDVVEATWNRALANLAAGNLEQGWKDHEIRWQWKGFPSTEKKLSVPKWNGERLEGKSLLLWAEQGLGDQIMFLTLALPLIRDSGAEISIEVDQKLVNVVAAWYPEAEVSAMENFECVGLPRYAKFDYHLPIGSLPLHFLPDIDAVRTRPIRFLRGDPLLRDAVMEEAEFIRPELPLVGVCWRSSLVNTQRSSGYLSVEAVAKLARDLEGECNFVSLQYAMSGTEIEVLSEFSNVFVPNHDFYSDVTCHAKHIGICDFVVTAGTLTSQLAGLFNRNTLIWGRGGWTFLGQTRYPWFPNHATLALDRAYSRSSLVFQLSKWLKMAIEHVTS